MQDSDHVTIDCGTGGVQTKPMTAKEKSSRDKFAADRQVAEDARIAAEEARRSRIKELHAKQGRNTADNTELINLLVEHVAPDTLA